MGIIPIYKLGSPYKSKVYNSGHWVDGEKTKELEEKLKEYLHVPYVVLTNNGTSALLAAYWVLKSKYKKLVIDPYTFPSAYQAARVLNYTVNFRRFLLNNNSNKVTFSPKSKLLTITHLFGQPNCLLAQEKATDYIEDACQAFGAKYKGKFVGTFGKIGCFSFYPTKLLHTCGHGGAVVTSNEQYYRQLKIFIESGRENGIMTDSVALNLRIDEIKAEYLLNELKEFDSRVSTQHDIAYEFRKYISGYQPFLKEDSGNFHTYSIFNLLISKREKFRGYMDKLGIQTLVYYSEKILPKDQRPYYRDVTSAIVAIPCRWNLTRSEIRRITYALQGWFQ